MPIEKWALLSILLISLNANASETAIDCANPSVKNTVIHIVEKHTPSPMSDFVFKHPDGKPYQRFISDPEYGTDAKVIGDLESEIARMDAWFDENERAGRSFDGPQYLADRSEKFGDLNNANKKLFGKLLANSEYTLSVIRTESRDETLGKASCAAKLSIDVLNWGSAQQDIDYRIETTSDGDLYITVSGLDSSE